MSIKNKEMTFCFILPYSRNNKKSIKVTWSDSKSEFTSLTYNEEYNNLVAFTALLPTFSKFKLKNLVESSDEEEGELND